VFDPQPHLVGDLVELRPLAAGDFAALFAVAADPLIWEQHPVRERYREEVFRVYFADQLASGGGLLVLDRRSGAVIGSTRYHGYDPGRSEVEVGWTFLARSHWGGRYNGELKTLMLGHAFTSVETVVFIIHPDNIRSQRAVAKLGARPLAGRPDATGTPSLAYALTRPTLPGPPLTDPR
jgi:RimJ/RimL family protein N-acetyltransferase